MGDEAEERLVCKLKVGMRVGRFKLKIHLRNRLMSSSWKLHRLSFVVRFRKHHLRIDSESKPECGRKSPDSEDSYGVLWRRRVEEKVESKKKMDPWFVSRGCGSNAHHRHSLFSTDKITFSFCQSCSQ